MSEMDDIIAADLLQSRNDSITFTRELTKVTDFYAEVYSLAHIIRYSMKPVIRHESVAEHSYFVALGVVLLFEVYYFDLPTSILIAVCHDVPEIKISDVNHMVKKSFPDVAKAIKIAENAIIENLPSTVKSGAKMYDGQTTESKIVHLADAMQCMQYSSNEMRMGNTGYMKEVYENSSKRVNELHVELESCRKWKK